VARAVVASNTGPIQHERHRKPVQPDVHQNLVEGPVQERRVYADDRMQATHRHPGSRGDRVLLGDTDVEDPLRVGLRKRGEPHRMQHGRGDRDHVGPGRRETDDLVGEATGPAGGLGQLDTRHGIESTRPVQVVELVVFSRTVAESLAGHAMHDDRTTEPPGAAERDLDRGDVVAIDGPDVFQAEVFEQSLRREDVFQAALDSVQRIEQRFTDERRPAEHFLDLFERLLVARVRPQRGEVLGEAADRLGVRAAVVVDEYDDRPILGGCDVVQGFPAHATGERSVTDDGDHGALLTTDGEGLGHPVGVTESGRGVRVLDPVVLGLGT
jgi:hypothetical protein